MQFRQSAQRDDRRRRVLTEDVIASSGQGGRSARDKHRAPDRARRRTAEYGDPSFREGQPRIIDLIPAGFGGFLFVFLLGATAIAGLEALYAWMPELAPLTTDGRVAALDLDGEGSLAAWFSSTLLGLSGLAALVVYSVRRHRPDDYQGRYRIWLLAGACFLVMSIDESASLHEGFKEMMIHLTGRTLTGDGSLWWAIPYSAVLGLVGLKLLADMRRCRAATTALVMTGAAYVLAVVVQLEWLLPGAGARAVMLEEGSEMAGNLLLLLAVGLFGRYSVREAQGLIVIEDEPDADDALQRADAEDDEAPRSRGRSREMRHHVRAGHAGGEPMHSAGESQAPRTSPRHAPAAVHDAADENVESEDLDDGRPKRKLSKAQRKALRKQRRAGSAG